MIRLFLIGVPFAILFAFLIGLMSQSAPLPVAPITAVRMASPSVARPGWEVRGSADYFAALHPPPPPPAPPPPPPKPPEPDIATLFRHDVGAIVSGPRVVIAGMDKGQRIARTLRVGDTYAQGWRIAALSTRSATLRRGREQRLVNFFSSSPPVVGAKGH